MGKPASASAVKETPAVAKKSADEVKALIPAILKESDLSKQQAAWTELKDSKSVTAFGSADLRTFPVSQRQLEERAGLTGDSLGLTDAKVSLDDFKFATLYVTGGSIVLAVASLALLPPNIGATLCYLFALIPILFLGIGSSAPGVIANAIAGLKGKDDESGATQEERICRHEAAHFCCGYWCGLPVREYSVEEGVARVEFGVSASQYSKTEVAALSVTALAGLVGEAMKWGKATTSGAQDLMSLEGVYRRSAEFIGAAAQQDLTRWGALTASLLLRKNADKYEQVVSAFGRQADLEECIAILES
jgi:hypothetical protein